MTSWLASAQDSPFGLHNLPYGVFSTAEEPGRRRIGVAVGDSVLDAGAAARAAGEPSVLLDADTLDPLLAAGRPAWTDVRASLTRWLSEESYREALSPHLYPADEVTLHLPFTVGDYVDFYASERHATNLGKIFRPGTEPLTPNWKHLPIGYHGRSGSVVVSGTDVARPHGQRKAPTEELPSFGPSRRLDIEAEVAFVVGAGSELGEPVPQEDFREHVFGVCLLNDWSSRDLQAWEYVPLGPFLGKSFATSLSPWVVPLDALEAARVQPPARTFELLPYLADREDEPWGLDISLTVRLNGQVISRPPFAGMYWTAAQMLAHMTVNGASVRPGDLFASGTVSGSEPDTRGALIELTWNGQEPVKLDDGTTRSYLEDGDTVTISATAPGPNGTVISFGEVTGRIVP